MSIEESLAALLREEVNKRVAAVQAAADQLIAEFRTIANKLASGEAPKVVMQFGPPFTYITQTGAPDDGKFTALANLPPEVLREEQAVVHSSVPPELRSARHTQIDESAIAANMSVR